MTPFWMHRKWSIFFLISSTLLYVTLSSVKGFKKTMTSSLAGNDRRIMVRSSSKLFWNGVPDRIIRFLVQSSARAFRISLFGRPLLKFIRKSELFYQELRSKTTLKSFVASYACYFRQMMKPWISSILWQTTWHIEEYIYEIRKKLDQLVHIHNGGILDKSMSKFKLWHMIKCCICQNSNFDIWSNFDIYMSKFI